MDFTKCQGCQLLTSIPAAARATLRHFEVSAVLEAFQAQPPLAAWGPVPQRSFVYVVVTDWTVLLVSLPSPQQRPTVLLEVPLLLVEYMDSQNELDARDVVNDARGTVDTACITLWPQQQQHQQQHQQQQHQQQAAAFPAAGGVPGAPSQQQAAQAMVRALQLQLQHQLCSSTAQQGQQQAAQPPWKPGRHTAGASCSTVLAAVPESSTAPCRTSAAEQQWLQPLKATADADADALVQHVASWKHDSTAAACFTQHQQPAAAAAVHGCSSKHINSSSSSSSSSYRLVLLTVERSSRLWFHLHKAWEGAHMRAALAAAGAPGLSSWSPPPCLSRHQHTTTAAAVPASRSRRQCAVDILVLPSTTHSFSMQDTPVVQHDDATLISAAPVRLQQQDQQQQQQQQEPAGTGFAGPAGCSTQQLHQLHQQHLQRRASTNSCTEQHMLHSRITPCHTLAPAGHTSSISQQAGGLQVISRSWLPARPVTAGPRLTTTARTGSTSASSSGHDSSSSSSRPSSGGSKQLLQQRQPQQQQGSGGGQWRSVWRRWSLGALGGSSSSPPPSRGRGVDEGRPGSSGSSSPPGSPPGSRGGWRPVSRAQQHVLREFMQAGAEVLVQPTASAAREVFWELADGLCRPCSLFDAGDTLLLTKSMSELAASTREQAAAMQAAFFDSCKVMDFVLARLTSWGTLMGLFPAGLPPIQNPAQPGCIESWQGRPVVWATWLLYPGRPRALMRRLGVTGSSAVCFRSALQAATSIGHNHRAAAKAWTTSSSSGRSGSNSIRPAPLNQTYYADPLNLSPLHNMPYLFVADARRMLADSSSDAGAEGGHAGVLSGVCVGTSGACESGDASDDLTSRGTLTEATAVLRWERLVGRLAAGAAERKVLLLLQWLTLHLSFTEGISSRTTWLSDKACTSWSASSGGLLPPPWSFRAATQQLVATLLTLHLQGTRHDLLCGGVASGPGSVQDMLWWAEGAASSAHGSISCGLVDAVVALLHDLAGLAEVEEVLAGGGAWTSGSVLEVMRQVPPSCLQPLLRVMFLRFICLLTATSTSHNTPATAAAAAAGGCSSRGGSGSGMSPERPPAGAAAVLAFRYGSVLLELLGGVLGCTQQLHMAFGVEVTHLMAVPQVQAKLAAAAAVRCPSGVLGRLNQQLLGRVLAAVQAAGKEARQQQGPDSGPAPLQDLRCAAASVMKVQN